MTFIWICKISIKLAIVYVTSILFDERRQFLQNKQSMSQDPVVYKKEWEQQLVSYFTKNLQWHSVLQVRLISVTINWEDFPLEK